MNKIVIVDNKAYTIKRGKHLTCKDCCLGDSDLPCPMIDGLEICIDPDSLHPMDIGFGYVYEEAIVTKIEEVAE